MGAATPQWIEPPSRLPLIIPRSTRAHLVRRTVCVFKRGLVVGKTHSIMIVVVDLSLSQLSAQQVSEVGSLFTTLYYSIPVLYLLLMAKELRPTYRE